VSCRDNTTGEVKVLKYDAKNKILSVAPEAEGHELFVDNIPARYFHEESLHAVAPEPYVPEPEPEPPPVTKSRRRTPVRTKADSMDEREIATLPEPIRGRYGQPLKRQRFLPRIPREEIVMAQLTYVAARDLRLGDFAASGGT
jgi:hypothetical protein